MKRLLSSILAVGINLAPLSVTLIAQPSWGQTQDSYKERLYTLIIQAGQQQEQGQHLKAVKTWQQLLELARTRQAKDLEYYAFLWIGHNYANDGQPEQALKYYDQALTVARGFVERGEEADVLNSIGGVYSTIGQPQRALEFFNQALPNSIKVGDKLGEAATLNNIGVVYLKTGQPQLALEFFKQSLPILKDMKDRDKEAGALNNIGEVYRSIGQFQQSLDYYNKALTIRREVKDRRGEASTLNSIGGFYNDIRKLDRAIEFYVQAVSIYRQLRDRSGEATVLNNIALISRDIGQTQQALELYSQALQLVRDIRQRREEATTLNNIAGVYDDIGQPQRALELYNQALVICKEVSNRSGEAATLNNIGIVYKNIGQPQRALKVYNLALSIVRELQNRSGEVNTLSNIAALYEHINQPNEAITQYEKSLDISLEMRGSLQRENRKSFYLDYAGTAIALTSLLIDQNQPAKAYEWINRVTTAELVDYTRLVNAKIANPEAQKAIDEWNQKNQQLQFLYNQLQDNFSNERSRQMREVEAEVFKQAEDISRQFPEVAELFETKPTDIAQLQSSIPPGTVIVHPVLLTGVNNLPNNIAIFVLTKDKVTVTKKTINYTEFDKLVKDYGDQLQDRKNTDYPVTSTKLYDILLRPVEDKIQAQSPTQLSIITSGKLRYIPFETLRDSQTGKYLIEKYPVNYLTRLSNRSWQSVKTLNAASLEGIAAIAILTILTFWVWRKFGIIASGLLVIVLGSAAFLIILGRTPRVLALGNPVPVKPFALNAAEAEVNSITNIFTALPGEVYIGDRATLDTFKTQAPRFAFLHLATHGCFQPEGCCLRESKDCQESGKLDMQSNTILFANNQQFNIADAALLGLKNTELLTLSACQTAQEANSNGEEIAGVAYIFERAGAKAVIASLWSGEDNAMKDVMVAFYQNLKKGMDKGEALRGAKLSQINSHPYFWSPLILIGDAR
ncbi:tetratricopeptide repeat protein [Microcoleus sp. FACHB-831]|uniref:CHAT domain-containing protein n=1 Tax=Microcoleus sp. FACHB-831 TaxID=2692827 RepID=UPI00168424B7|nr:tetratricopeptide repeat protein [Microcoleus sp. FACHB-831]MBD1924328.1 tetratricopeptide repeat protein [Microcoleus sp. FACHB-831]